MCIRARFRLALTLVRSLSLMLWVAIAGPASAEGTVTHPPADPVGQVVLTVNGPGQAAAGTGTRFDLDMLQALPQVAFDTSTIWTNGKVRFAGVPLAALVDHLGLSGRALKAQALNDYAVEIPLDSLEPKAPIIAYQIDGSAMSRRDKGPLWIVYPYDEDDKYRSEAIYARSIWQLDRIEVLD